jgi:hypothetical protein
MRLFFLLFLVVVIENNLVSQEDYKDFIFKADSISTKIFSAENDTIKDVLNEELKLAVFNYLQKDESVFFPYDSLKFAKYVQNELGDLRLLTWVVPLDSSKFFYTGFLTKVKFGEIDTVIELKPSKSALSLTESYSGDNWPGAVYTRLISNSVKGENFYTLIGWQGKDAGISGRIIEALWFNSEGLPNFGLPVFRIKSDELQHRYLFEFTNQVPFHLAYERHRIPGKKKTDWMIIFNRIIGVKPGMGSYFRGAVPSYEFFDAFVFNGNQWVFFEDIDPRIDSRILPDKRPENLDLAPKK